MLRCTLEDDSEWQEKLPVVEFAYNTSEASSTGTTPYETVYGRAPRTPLGLSSTTNMPRLQEFLQNFQSVWDTTRRQIVKAQVAQRKYANKSRASVEFNEGDLVLLSTANINLKGHSTAKLKPRWLGPFRVVEKLSTVVYRLQLPETMQIHPVFHVSLLKKYLSPDTDVPERPAPTIVDGEAEYEVDRILGDRRRRGRNEYLV